MKRLPVIGKPGAPRTVAVILIFVGVLELGFAHKVGQIWALAFTGTPRHAGQTPQTQQQANQQEANNAVGLGINAVLPFVLP